MVTGAILFDWYTKTLFREQKACTYRTGPVTVSHGARLDAAEVVSSAVELEAAAPAAAAACGEADGAEAALVPGAPRPERPRGGELDV